MELLTVVDDIEAIREKGKQIHRNAMSTMPNVCAVLRKRAQLQVGTQVYDWFGPPYNKWKWYKGKITKMATTASPSYKVTFEDKSILEYADQIEVRNALDIRDFPEWGHAVDALEGAFTYLEMRLTDDPSVDEPYRLATVYAIFEQVRVFNPAFALADKVTSAVVEKMLVFPVVHSRRRHQAPG